MRSIKVGISVIAIALLGACAQQPKKQAFNREAATKINVVVVTQWPNEQQHDARILAHPGQSFGLIGALIETADGASKIARLTAAVDPAQTRLRERFSVVLRKRLEAAGYTTRLAVLPTGTKDEQLLAVAKQQADGDAFLRVGLSSGYLAAGPTTDYFPHLNVSVRAIDSTSGSTLYEEAFTYGLPMPASNSVHLASDSRYRFASMDALASDPQRAREGWFGGLDAIAAQVAADLKKH